MNVIEGGGGDYWAGAVKYCHDLGLHLPSEQTLAMLAGATFEKSDVTISTSISGSVSRTSWLYWFVRDDLGRGYWSNVELSDSEAKLRTLYRGESIPKIGNRMTSSREGAALCVGD